MLSIPFVCVCVCVCMCVHAEYSFAGGKPLRSARTGCVLYEQHTPSDPSLPALQRAYLRPRKVHHKQRLQQLQQQQKACVGRGSGARNTGGSEAEEPVLRRSRGGGSPPGAAAKVGVILAMQPRVCLCSQKCGAAQGLQMWLNPRPQGCGQGGERTKLPSEVVHGHRRCHYW